MPDLKKGADDVDQYSDSSNSEDDEDHHDQHGHSHHPQTSMNTKNERIKSIQNINYLPSNRGPKGAFCCAEASGVQVGCSMTKGGNQETKTEN